MRQGRPGRHLDRRDPAGRRLSRSARCQPPMPGGVSRHQSALERYLAVRQRTSPDEGGRSGDLRILRWVRAGTVTGPGRRGDDRLAARPAGSRRPPQPHRRRPRPPAGAPPMPPATRRAGRRAWPRLRRPGRVPPPAAPAHAAAPQPTVRLRSRRPRRPRRSRRPRSPRPHRRTGCPAAPVHRAPQSRRRRPPAAPAAAAAPVEHAAPTCRSPSPRAPRHRQCRGIAQSEASEGAYARGTTEERARPTTSTCTSCSAPCSSAAPPTCT